MIKKEIKAYLIAGVLTTLINIAVYYLCYNIGEIPNLLANVIAWVVSVIFAYFANDYFVFTKTRGGKLKEQWRKMKLFFGARLFSLAVDRAGMYLLVDVVSMNNILAKVIMNVIIVILNYILSKWVIFKK